MPKPAARCLSSSRERERERERAISPFLHPFVLFSYSTDWIISIGKVHLSLLSSPIQMLVSSRNTLTGTPRNNVLLAIWASISLLKLTHKINHHIAKVWKIHKYIISCIMIKIFIVCGYSYNMLWYTGVDINLNQTIQVWNMASFKSWMLKSNSPELFVSPFITYM